LRGKAGISLPDHTDAHPHAHGISDACVGRGNV
jgi:hypothetical protein